VVIDRNRITGGGVTAGIDFGLTIASILYGEEIAKITQLLMEYNPVPPFDTGSPEKAGPELVEKAMRLEQGSRV
jgi:cyclohexyl-isocyanide hydratase